MDNVESTAAPEVAGNAVPWDLYTDDSCNLSSQWLKEQQVGLLRLGVALDGQECSEAMVDDPVAFYTAVRDGARPSTSAIPRGRVEKAFLQSLKRGRDIFYIGLPAVLSSNFEQLRDIANSMAAECGRRICCMDSRLATMGQGLLVKEAIRLRDEGRALDSVHASLNALSDHIRILFMLDDPQYLKVGGRAEEALEWVARFISRLNIKPVLTINRQCTIKFHGAHRSRKRALAQMMEYLSTMVDRARKQAIYVVHADIPRLAQMAIDAVHETLGSEQEVALAEVPPVLGAHVGPGTIALVFVSTDPRV